MATRLAVMLVWALCALATASAADEAADAARAEELMARKEAQQEVARRASLRAQRAILATDRARRRVRACGRGGSGTVWYDCRFDTFEPYRTAYEQLYHLFLEEETARYERERER